MTQLLDERTRRRAKVRAVAGAIVDERRQLRRLHAPASARLRPAQRLRRHATVVVEPAVPRHHRRRLVAALILLLQVCALAAVLWLPAFRVSAVTVSGAQLLDRTTLLRVAGVPQQSIFTLDGDAVANRLRSLNWIRSVKVSTELPSSVHIAIAEWQPMVRVRRDGTDLVLAENGVSLPVDAARRAGTAAIPLLIDLRSAATRTPVSPRLIKILGDAAGHFPAVFGVHVIAYQWDADSRFSAWTSAGWRAVLGHLDTSAAIEAVPGQLAALSVLRAAVSFIHPNFGYVDLENSAAPATGGQPGIPAQVTAALNGVTPQPSASPAPAPSPPSAAATASPTLAPTPTPSPPQLQAPSPPSGAVPPGIP